jgi:streptomycin 6-kinase
VTYTWLIVFGPVPRSIKPKSPSRISATADTPLPLRAAGERQLHTVVEQALEDDDEAFIEGRVLTRVHRPDAAPRRALENGSRTEEAGAEG